MGFTLHALPSACLHTVHPHVRGVYGRPRRAGQGKNRSIPTCVGFTSTMNSPLTYLVGPSPRAWGLRPNRRPERRSHPVHPHVRGVYMFYPTPTTGAGGPSPRAWGLRRTCWTKPPPPSVHPHVRGVYIIRILLTKKVDGPSPRAWGLRGPVRSGQTPSTVHPHVRGVYTEIKSKISRVSIKTELLPAEKFKILFLVKIKGSAAAFLDHTIFRDQSPPGLHFEIALHL